MNRMVIDLETLAVPEKLAPGMLVDVCQVGVVIMDDLDVMWRGEWNVACCGAADDSTVRWWMVQAVKREKMPEWAVAREMGEAWDMVKVLRLIAKIWELDECKEVWSKGTFDSDILGQHFGAQKMLRPWSYGQVRDLRTLMKATGVKGLPYEMVRHEALADALEEAECLRECLALVGDKPRMDTDGYGCGGVGNAPHSDLFRGADGCREGSE